MENIAEQTLGSIVAGNFKAASVFEKYQLDFCCGGKHTLAKACADKNINLQSVTNELSSMEEGRTTIKPFNQMSLSELIGYILIHHHFYVKQSMPQILQHLEKVATKHGDRYPYMKKVLSIFQEVNIEMLHHMQKEEQILFPMIKAADEATGDSAAALKEKLTMIVSVMETEHESAGGSMEAIRTLTNNYEPPFDACNTFKVSLAELKDFEEDLHKHVHLENNILFPEAVGAVAECTF
jgi:regulator of cell morphogenesis and NO signaling